MFHEWCTSNSSLTYHTRTLEHIQGLQSPPCSAVGPGRPARQRGTTVSTTNRRPDLGRGPLMRAACGRQHRVEGSRSSARLRHVQPDLWGQEQVRAHLRTPILQSARAHISRAVSLRDTVYETLSDSPPKQGAPEATSTIALSLRMVLTPHSRLACWLAAWLHWQHHPRWAGRCPSAARGKPPGSGRARQVETTGREHGHRCWPCSRPLSRLFSPRVGRRIDPQDRAH